MSRATRFVRTSAAPRLPTAAEVAKYVRARENRLGVTTGALLALGVPLSLIGPLLITLLVWAYAISHRHVLHFWPTFWVVTLVSLPLMFAFAAALKGGVLDRAVDAGFGGADTMIGRYAQRRAALPLVLAEVANIGPRMVVHGLRRLRERRRAGSIDIDRCAAAVVMLMKADGGVPPVQLLNPGERPDVLEPLLGVLMFHEVADVSAKGDRVWVRSDVREALMKRVNSTLNA
jgi:hypothetical protein